MPVDERAPGHEYAPAAAHRLHRYRRSGGCRPKPGSSGQCADDRRFGAAACASVRSSPNDCPPRRKAPHSSCNIAAGRRLPACAPTRTRGRKHCRGRRSGSGLAGHRRSPHPHTTRHSRCPAPFEQNPEQIIVPRRHRLLPASRMMASAACTPDNAAIGTPAPGCVLPPAR